MGLNLIKLLRVYLFLVAAHSFCVGVGLSALPIEYFGFFGFEGYQGDFFKIQAGVFHFVVCGAYIPAAINPAKNRSLILFSIFAKFTATVFLLLYALFAEMIWMVLASGIFDFLMGLILIWFYRKIFNKRMLRGV
ncbi:MAG TPA: hypothetical protein ENI20_08960 [Bacteroides sp.]|nr:hypothetical protein [Bacteroides sp.]